MKSTTGMRSTRVATIVVAALALAAWAGGAMAPPAHAAVDNPPIWESLWAGDGNGYDSLNAMTVGGGSLYSAGYRYYTATGDDVTVTRHDDAPDGWSHTWNNTGVDNADGATAIAVRGSAVYVAGWTVQAGGNEDFLLLKYSTAGDFAWARTWGAADRDEAGMAMKIDGAGNVVVGGQVNGASPGFGVVKWRPDGTRAWSKVIAPASGGYLFKDLVLDAAGNAYVCGSDEVAGREPNAILACLAPGGGQHWVKHYDANHGDDAYLAVCRAPGGGVFAVGRAASSASVPTFDALLTRYTKTGVRSLTMRWGILDGYDQVLNDCAVEGHGWVAVCGAYSGPDPDFYVAAIKPTGSLAWSHRYDEATADDSAERLIVDSAGRVCVAGVLSAGGGPQAVAVYAYNGAGKLRWSSKWWGTVSGIKSVRGMASMQTSNVWVCGSADNGASGGDQLGLGWVQP